MENITFDDFLKVDIRVGTVTNVEDFPEAKRPAYKLTIDLGELGIKKSSAQITNYTKEELKDRQVLCVVNFPPRQVANFMSEVLTLGLVTTENKTVYLIQPDRKVQNGLRLA